LKYAGHTGTGFNERELSRVMALLKPLETKQCPFTPCPKTNEKPHWVEPTLVAQVKFTEWTADDKLRHPVYLGLRDDKRATDVRREDGTPAARRAATFPVREKRKAEREDRKAVLIDKKQIDAIVTQLRDLEDRHRDGVVELPDGGRLSVTNLHKIFWPRL